MAAAALADGVLSSAEIKAMLRLGRRLDMSVHDIKQLVHKERRRLYSESRKALKEEKRQRKVRGA